MATLNKAELIELVAEKGYLSKRDATEAIELCFDLIQKALINGDEVKITNFGTFNKITKQGRKGTNPKTHEIMDIKETSTISFKPSKLLKNKLN